MADVDYLLEKGEQLESTLTEILHAAIEANAEDPSTFLRHVLERCRIEAAPVAVAKQPSVAAVRRPLRRTLSSAASNLIGSGILSVGGHVAHTHYAEQLSGWAADSGRRLPKQLLVQLNRGAIEAIGPLYVEKEHEARSASTIRLLTRLPTHASARCPLSPPPAASAHRRSSK